MTTLTRTYVTTVIALGALLLVVGFLYGPAFPNLDQYLFIAALALLGATRKVRLPGVNGNISLNFVFVLIQVAGFSFCEALISACSAALLQSLWKRKKKPQAIQVAFNVAVLALSTAAAYGIPACFQLERSQPIGIILSASAYFLVNSYLIAQVVSLAESRSLTQIWQETYFWTFPYYLAGAAIAAIITFGSPHVGWRALAVLILAYLSYQYFRTCVERRVHLVSTAQA